MTGGISIDPRSYARAVWKRKSWLLLPLLTVPAVALLVHRFQPPTYEASTLVLVEPAKVPKDYVSPTVTTDLVDRLRTLEQQITSRSNLERIINEFDLYPRLRQELPGERIVARARNDLRLQVNRNGTFRVSFRGPDPQAVAAVANRITDLFIEENLKLRENQARNTSTFLRDQLEETQKQLSEQESRVAAFRQRNQGSLPEQREANIAAQRQLETRLQLNREAVDKAELRRLILEQQAGLSEEGGARPSPRLERLRELQIEYRRLTSLYTDQHPDVVRLKRELESYERDLERADETPSGSAVSTVDTSVKAELLSLQREIDNLLEERTNILAQIDVYRRRLSSTPRVEQELIGLTRDYDTRRRDYEVLFDKWLDAERATVLELLQQSEQFRILERAQAPITPTGPNRLLVLLMGLAGGAALGLGLVFLREHVDDTFSDAESLQHAFPAITLMATIPLIKDDKPVDEGARRTA